MKKLKLVFCRIKCELPFHVKSLVNTILLTNNAKIYLGTQKFTKNVFFRRYGQNDGGSLEYRFFDHDTLFEFHEFQRYEVMDMLWWKFMIKKCFKQRVMIKRSIFQRTPIILSISSKKHVFGELLSFKVNFCIIGQQDISVDQNLHEMKVHTLSYKTLVSIFSYLPWFLRYFSFSGYRFLKCFIVRKYT